MMLNPLDLPQQPVPERRFQVDFLPVEVYHSEAELAKSAALFAHAYLRETLAQKEGATILLATGKSQLKFLDELIALGGIDWQKITFFHLDEYLGIEAEHPASFRRYLRERVESRVKPKQFHYLEGDARQPLDECDRYANLLKAQPIDLCCLGLGENGHLAFNEPEVADFNDPRLVKLVKLDRVTQQQQVNQGLFPTVAAVPQYAFTLTLPLLGTAKKLLCLAPEKRKAMAVKKMLQGVVSVECPASFLRSQAQAILWLDVDSASLLT